MYCSKCGAKIPDGAMFCPDCGEPIKDLNSYSGNPMPSNHDDRTNTSYPKNPEQPPMKNYRVLITVGIIAVLIIACVAIILTFSSRNRDRNSSNQNIIDTKMGSRILVPQRIIIFQDNTIIQDWVMGSFDYSKDSITRITFLDHIPDERENSWDASANGDGSVIAWVEPAGNDLYDLYIAAEGGVYASPDSEYLFSHYTSLKTIEFNECFYTDKVTNMKAIFYDCNNLTSLDLNSWDTSNATNMFAIFSDCYSLASLNIMDWDTSNVTDMAGMFHNCGELKELDLSNWNTSNVINMNNMFTGCPSLKIIDVSTWDTSNVTNMKEMFYIDRSLKELDLNGWDTSNVTDMSQMFYDCQSLENIYISHWDTSNVMDMSGMFYNCQSLGTINISGWNTSNVNDMRDMFYGCQSLETIDISGWDTSNVFDMGNMFRDCSRLKEIHRGSGWDESNANVELMFDGTQIFEFRLTK